MPKVTTITSPSSVTTVALGTAPSGGTISRSLRDGNNPGCLKEQVSITSASAGTALNQVIPAGSYVRAAGFVFETAATLATAVRVGLGTSADPDLFALSGTTVAAGTLVPTDLCKSPGLIFSNTVASAAVTNTNTETAFTFTGMTAPSIPANTLKPGDVIRIHCQGIATATDSTDTLAINIKVGTVTVQTQAANDVANSDIWVATAVLLVRAVGASGTVVACDIGSLDADATGDPAVVGSIASTALDTTVAADIVCTATWSVATLSNSCRCDILTVEHLRTEKYFFPSATTVYITPVDAAGNAAGTVVGTFGAYLWLESFDTLRDPS